MESSQVEQEIVQDSPLKEDTLGEQKAEEGLKSRPNSAFVQSLKKNISSIQTIFKKKQVVHVKDGEDVEEEGVKPAPNPNMEEVVGKGYYMKPYSRFFTFGRKKKASNEPASKPETPVAAVDEHANLATEGAENAESLGLAAQDELSTLAKKSSDEVAPAPGRKSLDFKRFMSLGRSKKSSDVGHKGFHFSLFPSRKDVPKAETESTEPAADENLAVVDEEKDVVKDVNAQDTAAVEGSSKPEVPSKEGALPDVSSAEDSKLGPVEEVSKPEIPEKEMIEPEVLTPEESKPEVPVKEDVKPEVAVPTGEDTVIPAPEESTNVPQAQEEPKLEVESPEVKSEAEEHVATGAGSETMEKSDKPEVESYSAVPKPKTSLFSLFKKSEKKVAKAIDEVAAPIDGTYKLIVDPIIQSGKEFVAEVMTTEEKSEAVDKEEQPSSDAPVSKSKSKKNRFSFNPFKLVAAAKPEVPVKETELEDKKDAGVFAEGGSVAVSENLDVVASKPDPVEQTGMATATDDTVPSSAAEESTSEEVSKKEELKMKEALSDATISPQTVEQ